MDTHAGSVEAGFDPNDPVFLGDPYPAFARLRDASAVHWHPGLGQYVAVSHAACSAVLRQRGLGRVWRDREPIEQFPAFNLLHQNSILESEPPTHTRLRGLVSGAFGRGHVERLRPWIGALSDRLVDDAAARLREGTASVDLIADVAEPLPVEVIAELVGVPPSDRGLLRPWSNAIVKMYEYGLDPARQRAAEAAAAEFVAYLRELVSQRRRGLRSDAQPGEDLLTDLILSADTDGARLSEDEVVATVVLLLMAGHEATVNVVGNGMLALLRNPDQWHRVLDNPDAVAGAAEEMLRFDSALQLFERTAVRQVEIADTVIEPGEKISALLGAANRDPAVFDDPDAFRVDRAPNPHLAFGAGIHFCLGAPLARLEIQAVLDAVRRRLPGIQLADSVTYRQEFVIRGLTALPVSG